MITSPYAMLRVSKGMPADWTPDWAVRREVRRIGGRTTYYAHPEVLTAADIADLYELIQLGWSVSIDGPRLGRIRTLITNQPTNRLKRQ